MSEREYNNVLALETATPVLRLALRFGGDRLVKSEEEAGRSHGQMILRKISNLFESANAAIDDLDGLIVNIGPGSFTGLRIGIAVAKGIAVALDIPIVGLSLFDIAAAKMAGDPHEIKLIVPFKRDEFFLCPIKNGAYDLGQLQPVPMSELNSIVAAGNVAVMGAEAQDWAKTSDDGDIRTITYDAADLLNLGIPLLENGQHGDLEKLEPLYILKSQAEIRFDRRAQGK